jgi:hypothetical protein
MTLAADEEYRALNGLAIVTGGAAFAAVALLIISLVSSPLVSSRHATTDVTPTFGSFDRSPGVPEAAPFAVASPAVDVHH